MNIPTFILEANTGRRRTEYADLTKISIYSVPKYPEYPFLDPHWIVRVDGRREVGPNAVPVFSPYAYSLSTNLRYFIPKIFESSRSSVFKILKDRQFLALASNELKSSLKKTAMINRAKNFYLDLYHQSSIKEEHRNQVIADR